MSATELAATTSRGILRESWPDKGSFLSQGDAAGSWVRSAVCHTLRRCGQAKTSPAMGSWLIEARGAFATRWSNDDPVRPCQRYQGVDDGRGRQITRTVLALDVSGWLSDKQD